MHQVFSALHPVVADWADTHLGTPTPPQNEALGLLLAGRTTLIASPTGTGKTLAAFLPVMSRLAEKRDADVLFARPVVLYVSPLRALGYDVEHNLRVPLREMALLERPNSERARLRRGRIRERFVRTGVRTGDTPVEERRLMMARPPHVLITTPESLALMLAMPSYRKFFTAIETVVIDEIHALAPNKRGAQLALLLESLDALCTSPPARVGLSATIAPLDRVAAFLAGVGRDCAIVDCRGLRAIRLSCFAPFSGAMARMPEVGKAAVELTSAVRSSLVFTNVRSTAERVAHEMTQHMAAQEIEVAEEAPPTRPRTSFNGQIGVHHSALERSVRHRVEAQLRKGEIRTVVCSSSLELGVDIGFVDRVVVIGGARGITPTLQRVGRAGHRPGAVADGVILAQDRDDIIEAAVVKRCIAEGKIEAIAIPQNPLDVLAQWLVGSVCYDRRVTIDEALAMAQGAMPFATLERADLVACARYLSGGGVGSQEAHVRRIGFDGEALYGLGRAPSAAFFENVGTIPDERHVQVRTRSGNEIGRVEEEFASALTLGDVFLLNGTTYRVKELHTSGVIVEPHAARPNVPTWSSHMKGIPRELAAAVGALRRELATRLRAGDPAAVRAWLSATYGLTPFEAAHAVRYIAQQAAISAVADDRTPLIEIYRMDGRQTAIYHTCAGRRINETLARVVGARVHGLIAANSQLTTDDNGFLIGLPARKSLKDAQWASLLYTAGFEDDLLAGLRASHLMQRYFRHIANTGLLVLRRVGGRSIRAGKARWNAERIFERIFRADRNYPLVRETIRTVTRDMLDAPGALEYLRALNEEPRVIHPPAASPFAFGIVTSSFGDAIAVGDRSSMVEAMHERILALVGGDAILDEAATVSNA